MNFRLMALKHFNIPYSTKIINSFSNIVSSYRNFTLSSKVYNGTQSLITDIDGELTIFSQLYSKYLHNKHGLDLSKLVLPKSLKPFANSVTQLIKYKMEEYELRHLETKATDPDLKHLANEDLHEVNNKIQELQKQVFQSLLKSVETEAIKDFSLEVSPGVGGQEAMLFAGEIFKMYHNFCLINGWRLKHKICDETELGGIRSGYLLVSDRTAYNRLKFEGGIHRVQRIPKTEKAGRIHTSTVSVVVIPQPDKILIEIEPKDLKIETMRSSGPGGQHVNKTDSAVRVTHLPSGCIAECQTSRSQNKNMEEAIIKLRARLYEEKLDRQETELYSKAKLQIGSKARSEKIRTYNFPQDRVTDHRLPFTVNNLESVLSGGSAFDKFISELAEFGNRERLKEILQSEMRCVD